MKVAGKIIGRLNLGNPSENEYTIKTLCSETIPLDADVAVEWDDRSEMTLTEIANVIEETSSDYEAICEAVRMLRKHAGRSEGVHQCKLANELSRRMGKHQGKWYVMELWRGRHCPYCGEKLP